MKLWKSLCNEKGIYKYVDAYVCNIKEEDICVVFKKYIRLLHYLLIDVWIYVSIHTYGKFSHFIAVESS
jgi:hypothetical protein